MLPLKKESHLLPCSCVNPVASFKGKVQLPPVAGGSFVLSKKKNIIPLHAKDSEEQKLGV